MTVFHLKDVLRTRFGCGVSMRSELNCPLVRQCLQNRGILWGVSSGIRHRHPGHSVKTVESLQ
jgi:hypothetical protein